MKKIFVISLLLLVLASVVGWAQTVSISLQDAFEIGLTNNLDIRLSSLRVADAEAELNRVKIVGDVEEIDKAEESFAKARETLVKAEEDLILQLERSYYELLKSSARYEEQKQALSDTQNNYEIEQARFEAGLISELALTRTYNSLLSAKVNFVNQTDTLHTAYYRFNELVGLSLEVDIVLTDIMDLTLRPLELTFDQALEIALLDSETIKRAVEILDTAKEAVRLASNEYTPRATLHKAKADQQRAEIDLEKAKNRVFFDVRTAYLRVGQQETAIDLAQRELDYAQRNVQVVTAQHRDGVASDTQLQNATKSVENAEKAVKDGIWEHIRVRRDLYNVIGQPEIVRKGDN